MKLIERTYYLNKLKDVMNIPDIKIITGIRRCGKSKLMDMFISFLNENEDNNVIRIKLTQKEFEELKDANKFYEYVSAKYQNNKANFLLVDEIQLCKNFENVINNLYEEEKYDIYLTGSNAFLLSSDLATLFGGRTYELSMYPFSFEEYLKYYPEENNDLNEAFNHYVEVGGLAGSYLYKNKTDAQKYLSMLVKTTITKDVVKKFNIENEDLLNMITEYLMDNVGNKTSLRNIANCLTSNTYKTNDKTVGSYVYTLCKSFLFYPFTRYDIKGKKYLESDKKYYLADISLRFAILGHKNMDYGHIYENIVAIELLRRGYEVYIGVLKERDKDAEIDFVAIKNGEKTYIQVSDDISNQETKEREIKPLLRIKDAYPKILLANTKHEDSQIEGVKIIDLAKWLSNTSHF